MWWFKPKQALKTTPGADKLVEMLTEQCCNWFEVPHQVPPKLVVFKANNKTAIYDVRTDTIWVYGDNNVTAEILAHEVAHAVVLKYGGISPRMHEILAGYAEFEVRKVFPPRA